VIKRHLDQKDRRFNATACLDFAPAQTYQASGKGGRVVGVARLGRGSNTPSMTQLVIEGLVVGLIRGNPL
jgi:hypothetical protein